MTVAGGDSRENLRPTVPRGRPPGTELVLWMSGEYEYFRNIDVVSDDNYDTGINLWMNTKSPSVATPRNDDRQGVPTGGGPVLMACSPNPSRGLTQIDFHLTENTTVNLSVFDVAGRKVAQLLANRAVCAGPTRGVWDGTDQHGRDAASGVYFARLRAGGAEATAKILIMR